MCIRDRFYLVLQPLTCKFFPATRLVRRFGTDVGHVGGCKVGLESANRTINVEVLSTEPKVHRPPLWAYAAATRSPGTDERTLLRVPGTSR
eukprot:1492242-Rhodomonas_salina.2